MPTKVSGKSSGKPYTKIDTCVKKTKKSSFYVIASLGVDISLDGHFWYLKRMLVP